MKSFRLRVTWWIALVLFGLMFVSLVAFNIYAIHEVAHHASSRMKTLSRAVLNEMQTAYKQGKPVTDATFSRVDASLGVLDPKGRLEYAVFTADGAMLHRSPHFGRLDDPSVLLAKPEDLMIRAIRSPDEDEVVGDLFSEWHFLMLNRGQDHVVLVSDREDYESLERFASGFLIVTLLAALFSIPCGYLLSRRILVPLAAIQDAVQEVRQGNLQARVPVPRSQDEIARLAESLNQTFADLENLLDGMSRFCADAAHELRTPLTALRGNLEVCLAKVRTPEEYQMALSEGVAEAAALSSMVHDLLLLSISGDRRRTASLRELAPGSLFRETTLQLSLLAEEKQIQLTSQIDDELTIRGDEKLLPRVCYNLVDNAIRYSPSGGTIAVTWSRAGDEAVLAVADAGIGIAPEDHERIFERFHQVDESRSRGTGLGLAIVKWIVELHDGHIEVQSELGQGATFRVCLPLPDSQA